MIKEWQYQHLVELCMEHQKSYVRVVLHHGNKSIKWSAWLRLMGLMET